MAMHMPTTQTNYNYSEKKKKFIHVIKMIKNILDVHVDFNHNMVGEKITGLNANP